MFSGSAYYIIFLNRAISIVIIINISWLPLCLEISFSPPTLSAGVVLCRAVCVI